MKRAIVFSSIVIVLIGMSGFAISKNTQPVSIQMHIKDLSHHGLKLIDASDPSFDGMLRAELKGKSNDAVEAMKPFSVFLKNTGKKTVVAYLVQWTYTRTDGTNQHYKTAVINPEALVQSKMRFDEANGRVDAIEPNASRLLTLLSPSGGGMLRVTLTPSEAEGVKNGTIKFDRATLMQRFSQEAEKYTAITVSIDGAFFADGTFVGPDTSNFFNQTKAAIAGRRSLLETIGNDLSNANRTRAEIFKDLEEIATQGPEKLDSESTPDDYHRSFKAMYANEILRMKGIYGDEKALDLAVRPLNRPWLELRKNDD
ncbi:MAG TPA: hypothetical protein VFS90_01510 [Pyrinomonadaceae bacterium]|nr:hypothetical protein [Pyrinomonadaceae bacterium]